MSDNSYSKSASNFVSGWEICRRECLEVVVCAKVYLHSNKKKEGNDDIIASANRKRSRADMRDESKGERQQRRRSERFSLVVIVKCHKHL